jgi:succinate dehydrogenase/fumarate reductase flavoprotein subunit/uncharacterized protein with FMN-binding domain
MGRMRKRWLAGILAASMSLSLMVGCSGTTPTGNQDNKYPVGTYTGSARGMWDDITVEVTLGESGIQSIDVVSCKDTEIVASAAIREVPQRILEAQSYNVDAASGATISSFGIKNAVKAALEEAGVNAEDFSKKPEEKPKAELPTENYDIVIVGSGGAGMSAAIQARKESDYSVLVLEKLSYVGGSTALSGGGIAITDSEYNTEVNFTGEAVADYFADTVANYSMEKNGIYVPEGGATVNKGLIARVFNYAAPVHNYFAENGFKTNYAIVTGHFGNNMGITCSLDGTGTGEARSYWMQELAEKNGVEFRFNSPVVDLVVNNGIVEGVIVESLDGTYKINAQKVILATGGFADNHELVKEKNSAYKNIGSTWSFSSPGNDGDVFELLADLDAAYVGYGLNTERGPAYPYLGLHYNGTSYITFSNCFVDYSGKLITEPTEKIYQWSQDILNAKDGISYALVSDTIGSTFEETYGMPYEDYMNNLIDMGFAYKADTLDELAELMNMDAKNLHNAADTVNTVAGEPDWLGFPIDAVGEDGPFYLAKTTVAVIGTLEGVKLNENMQVLNTKDEPIPNLYAAGEVAMGNFQTGRYVTSSTAVGIAVYGGALAADEVLASMMKSSQN